MGQEGENINLYTRRFNWLFIFRGPIQRIRLVGTDTFHRGVGGQSGKLSERLQPFEFHSLVSQIRATLGCDR